MSENILLGSAAKFDLRSVPYSICGSYMCILEDADDRCLYLSLTRSPSLSLERKNLIKIAPVLDGKALPFTYTATPEKLTISTYKGDVELCFAAEKQLRVRGDGGVGLRFDFTMRKAMTLTTAMALCGATSSHRCSCCWRWA